MAILVRVANALGAQVNLRAEQKNRWGFGSFSYPSFAECVNAACARLSRSCVAPLVLEVSENGFRAWRVPVWFTGGVARLKWGKYWREAEISAIKNVKKWGFTTTASF